MKRSTKIVTMQMLRDRVEAAAKATAVAFVDEFHEPLLSSQTDWDAEAWSIDTTAGGVLADVADEIRLPERYDVLWPLYVRTLEKETLRLCEALVKS